MGSRHLLKRSELLFEGANEFFLGKIPECQAAQVWSCWKVIWECALCLVFELHLLHECGSEKLNLSASVALGPGSSGSKLLYRTAVFREEIFLCRMKMRVHRLAGLLQVWDLAL
jgi:hypothetical protein